MVLGRLKIQSKHSKRQLAGRRSQCPDICDMVLSSTTPSKIKPMLTDEISFLTEKHHADQSRQNQSHACQSGIAIASGVVFSVIDKARNTPKS